MSIFVYQVERKVMTEKKPTEKLSLKLYSEISDDGCTTL